MSSDNNKSKETSKKIKDIREIEIENKDLLNVFFDKSTSQFESQLFLSRKRMLSAENGQSELSELLKSKLKALDMMILILTNNKNILKESDLSCCEVLNNLLSVSKKDKTYGEHIYSKIKTVILYILKNQLSLKEKNADANKVIIKFLITLLNIKFDNGYFKQILDIIGDNKEIFGSFINELFIKLFKGRNITIKIIEIKHMLKTMLFDEKIQKIMNYFDIMEKISSFIHEKESGGCRTSFQLLQAIFLLQYLIDITNIKEIKNNLNNKEENNKRLLKIIKSFKESINEFVDKNDYEFDSKKINKKELEKKNEAMRRKKKFFEEMLNLLNKMKNNFKEELENKDTAEILQEINNLYKNIINLKYNVIIKNNEGKKEKNKNNNKEETEEKNEIKEDNVKIEDNVKNEEEKKEKKSIELDEEKEEGDGNEEEEEEEVEKNKKKKINKDKKDKISQKQGKNIKEKNQKKSNKNNSNDSKKDNKNKKKKIH